MRKEGGASRGGKVNATDCFLRDDNKTTQQWIDTEGDWQALCKTSARCFFLFLFLESLKRR
jgi:hypothetical protein